MVLPLCYAHNSVTVRIWVRDIVKAATQQCHQKYPHVVQRDAVLVLFTTPHREFLRLRDDGKPHRDEGSCLGMALTLSIQSF